MMLNRPAKRPGVPGSLLPVIGLEAIWDPKEYNQSFEWCVLESGDGFQYLPNKISFLGTKAKSHKVLLILLFSSNRKSFQALEAEEITCTWGGKRKKGVKDEADIWVETWCPIFLPRATTQVNKSRIFLEKKPWGEFAYEPLVVNQLWFTPSWNFLLTGTGL